MKERLLYPDICKFFAIFLVTCSHCAQCISGQPWTNFFFGTHLDIAFNMPLFMLISGWFINLDKMRNEKPLSFFLAKFKRLMIPALVWYVLLFFVCHPKTSPISYYWYLSALFACMCIIYVFAKLIQNDYVCMAISTVFVFLCPKTDFVNINFMFPFLWAGVIINKLYNSKNASKWFWSSLIVGFILSFFWKTDYTIYCARFNILHFNLRMALIYLYRFVIGLSLSSVIIFLVKKNETKLSVFAKYGQYSLVVYTGSFVLNGLMALLLNHIGFHTNQMFIIDILSILLCIIIFIIIVVFGNLCRKNKITKLLFLGE